MTAVQDITTKSYGALRSGPDDASETFVFLHGWSGSKELWWNTLALLGDAYQGVALDLPGTGGTPLLAASLSMPSLAEWVCETVGALGLTGVTLVGHSLGGNLAAQTALDYPNMVGRLVLVDAALATASLPKRAYWTLSPRWGRAALLAVRVSALPLTVFGRYVPHTHGGGHWTPYARRTHLYVTRNNDRALQQQLFALTGNPLDASHLARLPMPLLIAHGAKDDIIPAASARALADALPEARLTLFPQARHCPMDTEPRAFADALRLFVQET